MRNLTKVFDVIEKIKMLKWKGAVNVNIARRNDNGWHANTLQWYPRNIKWPRKRTHVRWSYKMRKVTEVNWITWTIERNKEIFRLRQTTNIGIIVYAISLRALIPGISAISRVSNLLLIHPLLETDCNVTQ